MLFMIGGIFNIIGYLFISSATGLVGYLLITYIDYFNTKLNSPVIPTMVFIYFLRLGLWICWFHSRSHFNGTIRNLWRCFDALFLAGRRNK
jgi:membrane protein DedA with SNARE-associated domain